MPAYSPEQIRRWANEYGTGAIDPQDKLLFEQWLAQRTDAETQFNIPQERAELENELLHHIGAATFNKPAVKYHFAWIKYAAAIIIIAGVGAYLWNISAKKEKPAVAVETSLPTNISPGSNKAILTLSDGKKVELNNTSSETITDGSLSIANHEGQLNYLNPERVSNPLRGGASSLREEGVGVTPSSINTMTTPRGGQYALTLSDGTRVWLNASSSITYPTAFTSKTREVKITGEAYLEVAQNKEKPFIVKTATFSPFEKGGHDDAPDETPRGGFSITVLGTSFNINAYDNEPEIQTTLVDGKIKVSAGSQFSILSPGKQAVIAENNSAPLIQIQSANIKQVIAWKNGEFNFDKLTIKEAMKQISRWYDVEVKIENGLENKRFTGSVQRDLTLSELLHLLDGISAHFKLEGRTIKVSQ